LRVVKLTEGVFCLKIKDKRKLSELPIGARIGTSSIRRKRQLLKWNPDLLIEDVRGNVDTRIRKIEEGNYDALVLAYAGMKRLGLEHYVSEILPERNFYPAPGQGTILVQSRSGDAETDEILKPLDHYESAVKLACERAFLRRLEGGCQLPCGIFTQLEGLVIRAYGALYSIEESVAAEASIEGSAVDAEKTGGDLASMILKEGGQQILNQIRHTYG